MRGREKGNGTERKGYGKRKEVKESRMSLRNGNISSKDSFVPVLPSAGVMCACLRGFDD